MMYPRRPAPPRAAEEVPKREHEQHEDAERDAELPAVLVLYAREGRQHGGWCREWGRGRG